MNLFTKSRETATSVQLCFKVDPEVSDQMKILGGSGKTEVLNKIRDMFMAEIAKAEEEGRNYTGLSLAKTEEVDSYDEIDWNENKREFDDSESGDPIVEEDDPRDVVCEEEEEYGRCPEGDGFDPEIFEESI